MVNIGIDAGSSNIKIIAMDENETIVNKNLTHQHNQRLWVGTREPCCLHNKMILKNISVENAFEKFIQEAKIEIQDISKIILTGIRQKEIEGNIKGIKTFKVDEFEAVGIGATKSAKLEDALIISIGTGTAFIRANKGIYTHIGGTGVGGGTLINLCKRFAGLKSFNEISEKIKNADISKVDLRLKDIQKDAINSLLPTDITISNFGKLEKDANDNDVILGILNMIVETIGMMGIFATQNTKNKNIIVIGCITELAYVKKVLDVLNKLQNVNFIIPENSEWTVAIGAILQVANK